MYIRSALGARLSILLLGGIGFSQAIGATNIQVCPTCAYRSIQSAVDAAASGDTINIAAGLYVENVVIAWKQLTLIGAGGALSYCSRVIGRPIQTACGVTEVSAPPNSTSRVFDLGSGVEGDTPQLITIQGLTISHGTHPLHSGVGGGVQVQAGAYLHLSNSIVAGNTAGTGAGGGGGGIGVNTPGAPATTISTCLIEGNGAFGGYTYGGGIAVLKGSTVSIQNSTITRNQADEGGGIYLGSGSSLTMTGTTVSENTASTFISGGSPNGGNGGGLEAYGNVVISDSTFTGNTGLGNGDGGGGVLLVLPSGSQSSITSTIIDRNIASTSGLDGGLGVFGGPDSTLALVKDFIVENQNGGVLVGVGVNLVLTDTLITANTVVNLSD
jgi:Right handed beta helix region